MNNIKRDREILKSLVESYGKKDVLQFVNHLNESESFPDYDTLFEQTRNSNSVILQLRQQAMNDREQLQKVTEYLEGFYKWIMKNIVMEYFHTNYFDNTLISVVSGNHITQFDMLDPRYIDFSSTSLSSFNYKYNLQNYYEQTRPTYPQIRPASKRLKEFVNKYGDLFWDMMDKMNGSLNVETKEFE